MTRAIPFFDNYCAIYIENLSKMVHLRIQWVKNSTCVFSQNLHFVEVPPYFVFQTLNIVVIAEMSCFLKYICPVAFIYISHGSK